jgi:hypothetical protein
MLRWLLHPCARIFGHILADTPVPAGTARING